MPSPIYQQSQNNNALNMLAQFRQNPLAILNQRFNIPQGMSDPNAILQHLLNTNQVTQEQVNRVMQMKDNPQIQQMFKQS